MNFSAKSIGSLKYLMALEDVTLLNQKAQTAQHVFSTFPFAIQFQDIVQMILEFVWPTKFLLMLIILCIQSSEALEASGMSLRQVWLIWMC